MLVAKSLLPLELGYSAVVVLNSSPKRGAPWLESALNDGNHLLLLASSSHALAITKDSYVFRRGLLIRAWFAASINEISVASLIRFFAL